MAYAKYGQAMSVDCPKCDAKAGRPCTSPGGSVQDTPHAARKEAAQLMMETQQAPTQATASPHDLTGTTADRQMAETMQTYASRLRAEAEALNTKADALDMTARVVGESRKAVAA